MATTSAQTWWGMTRYQWTVTLVAWLGWGFGAFDALLFSYVAANCVPTVLGLPLGSPEAAQATPLWTGILTSLLLVGWGIGGIVFGSICDRIGRRRTVVLTIVLYALGTGACALAPNMAALILFRLIASIGIGGEWAAGAAMVAEAVPNQRRVGAGAFLYTAAPCGLFLATELTYRIQGVIFKANPEVAWRYVFACGLIPLFVAVLAQVSLKESEKWTAHAAQASPRLGELFAPDLRKTTFSGLGMAVIALIGWWSCNAFIPQVATGLAKAAAAAQQLGVLETTGLVESWKKTATNSFNWGGLIGTLITVPIAHYLGRRVMFAAYFLLSSLAIYATFGLPLPAEQRLLMCFFVGLSVFGVFGSFTYYLPELFPTRLRATGSGFTYNAGRFLAAGGPFLVGAIAAQGPNKIVQAISLVSLVPLAGLLLVPMILETKNRDLPD